MRFDPQDLLQLIPPGSRWIRKRGRHRGRPIRVLGVNHNGKVHVSLQEKGTFRLGRATDSGRGNYQTRIPLDHFMTTYDPADDTGHRLGAIDVHRWHERIGLLRCSCPTEVRIAASMVMDKPQLSASPAQPAQDTHSESTVTAPPATPEPTEAPDTSLKAVFEEPLFEGKMTIAEERQLVSTYVRLFNANTSGNWWSDLLGKYTLNYRQGGELLDRYNARPTEEQLQQRERDRKRQGPAATPPNGRDEAARRAAEAVRTLGEKTGQPLEMRAPAATPIATPAPTPAPKPAPASPSVAAPPNPPAPTVEPETARPVVSVTTPFATQVTESAAVAPIRPLPAPPREAPSQRRWTVTVLREMEIEVTGASLLDALAHADAMTDVVEVVGVIRARPR